MPVFGMGVSLDIRIWLNAFGDDAEAGDDVAVQDVPAPLSPPCQLFHPLQRLLSLPPSL